MVFFLAMNLHGHMKSHHKPEFGQKSNKRNIKKSINLQKKKRAYNTREFKCAECNFSCNHKYQIDYHGPYKHRICPICSCKVTGEYGESTNDIIHHVYEKHQQRFACLRCDKKFFSEAHKINHDYHSHRPGACIRDPKPKRLQSKDFKCRFCNFTSINMRGIKGSRIKKHLKIYPYASDNIPKLGLKNVTLERI